MSGFKESLGKRAGNAFRTAKEYDEMMDEWIIRKASSLRAKVRHLTQSKHKEKE